MPPPLTFPTCQICNFIVVKFTPSALANIGYRTYIIFAVFNFCWLPVIYFFLPETKGLVLEEIDALFAKDGWHLEHKLVAGGLVESSESGSGKSSPADVVAAGVGGEKKSSDGDADIEASQADVKV